MQQEREERRKKGNKREEDNTCRKIDTETECNRIRTSNRNVDYAFYNDLRTVGESNKIQYNPF